MKELIYDTVQWGYDKGILKDSYEAKELQMLREKQAEKTKEELLELFDAIEERDRHLAKDAIGDIIVTLCMQAELWETDIQECLHMAYDQISKRTGKMVDGQFVKDVA